jgi:hypothetical protein
LRVRDSLQELLQKPGDQLSNRASASASEQPGYGTAVRAQVFEVIVKQAIAGAPWREICAGPMHANDINPEEIEEELSRRRGEDKLS